jgi:hypothetical protein
MKNLGPGASESGLEPEVLHKTDTNASAGITAECIVKKRLIVYRYRRRALV